MTVVAARYGGWYARLVRQPGKETREGSDVARMVVGVRHNNCPVIVDVGGGWGAAAVGALERNGIPVVAFNGVNPSAVTSREGNLKFHNKRAEGWWRLREELDPDQQFGSAIVLPPGAAIKADLAAPRWELTPRHQGRGQERYQETSRKIARRRRCDRDVPRRRRQGGDAAVVGTGPRAAAGAGRGGLCGFQAEVLRMTS
jgi:hypothetical protein